MLEKRGSSYTMEAITDNHFKTADTILGNWIEISAHIPGEHLFFLFKESHQLRHLIAVRVEQLKIQSERVFKIDHKLKNLTKRSTCLEPSLSVFLCCFDC